ncbi:phage integrase [Deinococcus geothermalis DSM 11300]|uniref:Phage integrase n=1 Tax=Deinococcus geothermalis (strain DSM 11300 / CIP 105573 / AG-3a) TaxID=319795 RepID=Q1IZB9_DEIGD|nr:tyrosine-type recombinase/integrase [Deinococcus geothermalis]ABF45415.1 phage integrase [Deinococcus geothermalis DSM 11300]
MSVQPGTALQLASKWSRPENRRREGLRAAHTQDADTLIDLLNTYIRLKSSRKGRTSALTLKAYAESVRQFLAFTGPPESPSRALNQLSAEDFEVWLLHLQEAGLKPNTIKRHLYGVRNLMKALVWANVLKADPSAGVSPPTDPTPAHAKKRALTQAQMRALLALPGELHPEDSVQASRDALLLALGGTLGLRAAEIVGLDLADVDLATGTLTVRGKGGKTRVVPLPAGVKALLQRWLPARQTVNPKVPALLVSLSSLNRGGRLSTDGARFIAHAYYRQLGLPPEMWGLHTLRRTAGTHLYRATRDLHVVADLLGHASVTTSAIYAKMDADVRREAVEALERLQQEGSAAVQPSRIEQQEDAQQQGGQVA